MAPSCGWPVTMKSVALIEYLPGYRSARPLARSSLGRDGQHVAQLVKQIVEILLRQILELRQDAGDHPRSVALAIALAAVEFRAAHDIQRDTHRAVQARPHSG